MIGYFVSKIMGNKLYIDRILLMEVVTICRQA